MSVMLGILFFKNEFGKGKFRQRGIEGEELLDFSLSENIEQGILFFQFKIYLNFCKFQRMGRIYKIFLKYYFIKK